MLRDMRGPSKSGFKRSSGIGLAYRFALHNQHKRQYQLQAGLFIAGAGSLSALMGVFALCYGWYTLGLACLFCAGCATQGVNILSKMLAPATKIMHQQTQPILGTVGKGPQNKIPLNVPIPHHDKNSQADYPEQGSRAHLKT